MNPDDILKHGAYRLYKFNERDKHLREAGFYCEEIFSYNNFPLVLRRLAKQNPPQPDLHMLAILPANNVIVGENMSGWFALYMQVKGRLELSKEKDSKFERLIHRPDR